MDAVQIGNKSVSLGDLQSIVSVIASIGSQASGGAGVADIVGSIESDAASLIETISNFLMPGLGTIENVILAIIKNSRPMTQDETNAWMDRFGAGSQS